MLARKPLDGKNLENFFIWKCAIIYPSNKKTMTNAVVVGNQSLKKRTLPPLHNAKFWYSTFIWVEKYLIFINILVWIWNCCILLNIFHGDMLLLFKPCLTFSYFWEVWRQPHSNLHVRQQDNSILVSPPPFVLYSTWKCLANEMLEDNVEATITNTLIIVVPYLTMTIIQYFYLD